MPEVQVREAPKSQKATIANLMQLYSHDLSEYQPAPLRPNGLFDVSPYFEDYWDDPLRYPFLILADGDPAGFAFVRQPEEEAFEIAEFFIVRRYRRNRVGSFAATDLFNRFRGRWSIAQMELNIPAQKFWRAQIDDYTGGKFSEDWSDSDPVGPMQIFHNGR